MKRWKILLLFLNVIFFLALTSALNSQTCCIGADYTFNYNDNSFFVEGDKCEINPTTINKQFINVKEGHYRAVVVSKRGYESVCEDKETFTLDFNNDRSSVSRDDSPDACINSIRAEDFGVFYFKEGQNEVFMKTGTVCHPQYFPNCEGECEPEHDVSVIQICLFEEEPEPLCGNGIKESGEECDDGNQINNDACTNDCTLLPESTPLAKLPLNTCSGEGELFLYQGNPFQPLETSFQVNHNQVLIFTKGDISFSTKVNGSSAPLTLVKQEVAPFLVKVYSIETFPGATVEIIGSHPEGARVIQGYISQNPQNPAFNLDTFDIVYEGQKTNKFNITPGNYSFVIFDKYSQNRPWEGEDNRILSVILDGPSTNAFQKDYTKPFPYPTEGAVVDNYTITESGEHTFLVDTTDSVYWAFDGCKEPEPYCGDGILQVGEVCDEGQGNGLMCLVDYNEVCTYCSSTCTIENLTGPYCGDGETNYPQEQCDDGNDNDLDSCRIDCTLPYCGDNIQDSGELCDFGQQNGIPCEPDYEETCFYCSDICEPINLTGPYCGDGETNSPPEQCDDGNTNNLDSCNNQCQLNFCGDNITNNNEICDYGPLNGQECTPEYEQTCTYCTAICEEANKSGPYCGDGTIQSPEQCDDGNNINGDGCDANCEIEEPCEFCGDGILQSGEECDNGTLNGLICTPEYGSFCAYCSINCTTETIKGPYCGDGIKDSNEQCDDGNTNNLDECSNECTLNYCGDNITNNNEICDYGPLNGQECTPEYEQTCTYCTAICEEANKSGPYCGDGTIQSPEQCDDGNTNNLDECSNECTLTFCGDGVLQTGEQCDDGNNNNSDGCRNDCTFPFCGDKILDTGEECDNGASNGIECYAGYDSMCLYCSENCEIENKTGPYCGDGTIQSPEQCDDGNNINGDGCDANCEIEEPCEFCGDGILQSGEECDNGTLNGLICTPEYGSFCAYCSINCTTETIKGPYCGDGIKDASEQCDDGNTNNLDSCNNQCQLNFCGDNITNNNEICDYGPLNGQECTPEYEQTCTYCTAICEEANKSGPYCGDGTIQSPEQCDDGNNINGDGCDANCKEEIISYCGDSVQDSGEECDLGLQNGVLCTPEYEGFCAYCSVNCTTETIDGPYCTDGTIQSPEQCDDGNTNNLDECSNECKLNYCGDGIIQNGEQCDDGNNINGDGCDANCEEEPEPICGDGIQDSGEECDLGLQNGVLCTPEYEGFCAYCSVNCTTETIEGPYCGDNVLDSLEECDDGNNINGDGCSASCEIEIPEPVCGNNILETGEQCDDGNNINGDGCDANCEIEEPCEFCGDGILQSGEECDNGTLNGLMCTPEYEGFCAYCSVNCTTETIEGPYCGDNVLDSLEECDDGNNINGDGCSASCEIEIPEPVCGNGVKEEGEECDDGIDNGKICSPPQGGQCNYCSADCVIKTKKDTFVTTEDFEPLIWMCEQRLILDDATAPGRMTEDGQILRERINNYLFEGEQIVFDVLVKDKNGIGKVKDVYVTVGTDQGKYNDIEANCFESSKLDREVFESCNPRILEEEITYDDYKNDRGKTMKAFTCILTAESTDSMHGEYWVTVEAEDLDGEVGVADEHEFWFFNPEIELEIDGDVDFSNARPGTSSYSQTIIITNDAEEDSGVLLDMFISGTNFYDSSSSGGLCPNTNQLKLDAFNYFATSGAYSTRTDTRADPEGYVPIQYGIGFNDPHSFYNNNEIIQASPKEGPYYLPNILAPGADMSITLRLNLPEPCNGDFDRGDIFFWSEAI